MVDRKQLSEIEPKAKIELSARSFFEISEVELKAMTELSEKNFLINNLVRNYLIGNPEECDRSTWLVSPKKHNHVSNGGLEKWQNTENLAEQQAKEKH